jgi:hypothetical protein
MFLNVEINGGTSYVVFRKLYIYCTDLSGSFIGLTKVKVKVKIGQATKAQRGSGSIALLYL